MRYKKHRKRLVCALLIMGTLVQYAFGYEYVQAVAKTSNGYFSMEAESVPNAVDGLDSNVSERETETEFEQLTGGKSNSFTRNSYSGTYGYECLENDDQRFVYKQLEKAADYFHYSDEDVIVRVTPKPSEVKKTSVAKATPTSIPYSSISEEDRKNYHYYAVDVELEHNVKTKNVTVATVSFLYDHPEYFWSKGYTYTWIEESDMVTRVFLHCQEDYYDGKVRYAMWEKIENGIKGYLKQVSGIKDVYEKELVLHDAIAANMTYAYKEGTSEPESERWAHTIESVFSGEKTSTVCEGYAKAFQLLLNAAGIECNYVVGNGGNVGHAWNQVKLDGEWYNVDLTWDDTRDNSSHRYFNVSDANFGNHVAYTNSSKISVGSWCYPVKECVSVAKSFSNSDPMAKVAKYLLIIPEATWGTITVYNQGVEVENNSLVDEETTLDVAICPNHYGVLTDIQTSWGEGKYHYKDIIGENGMEFSFVIHSDTELSVEYSIPINMLSLEQSTYQIDGYGKKKNLNLVIWPEQHTERLKWESSNTAVVTVQNGVATSVGAGNAVITVSNEDLSIRCQCIVKVLAPQIKITNKKSKMRVGKVFMFDARITGVKGDVQWRVSDRKKATIDRTSGIFTAKKTGKVRVYAFKGNIETSIVVTIKK